MRKGIKFLCSIMLALIFICSTTPVLAAENAVSAEIVTDKEAYEAGEEIKVSVTVTNTAEEEVSDVNVRVNWPEGMTYAKSEDKALVFDTLAAGTNSSVEVVGTKIIEGPSPIVIAIIAVVVVVAVVAVVLVMKKKNGKKAVAAAALVLAMLVTMLPTTIADAGERVDVEKTITIDGRETTIGATITYAQYHMTRISRVTAHDPSVVYDPETDMYYIFGSHRAWAKSEDMINWKLFTNNINQDYATIFAEAAKWSANGGTQGKAKYNVEGNMWAPDVVYNETMGKWTMYMSINGDYWYSSIVLLTADTLDGDWTLVGPVVYSGFQNKEQALQTDFYDVYSGDDFPERYVESGGNHKYGLNAIDPCVFFDEEGRLWMAYGSWFGGIYMLELDPQTGLRLESHTYETVKNESDEYQGIKIAGGMGVSGEAPYIEHIGDYYYLYVSYGGFVSDGGYNMRVYRSEKPEGPYTDLTGDSPIATSGNNNINGENGVRVMGNYQWDYTQAGQVAQGHNSVYSGDKGIFVVYHTRFSNQGETHSVRVHQQFLNEDGWLVTAPFDYTGEVLSYIDKEDVVGDYKMIMHKIKVNYANKKCNTTVDISLNEDGTISGKYEGTWSFSKKLGAPYVTMVIDDVEYNGVFVKQRIEGSSKMAMTFTVLGDNEINLWGYNEIETE